MREEDEVDEDATDDTIDPKGIVTNTFKVRYSYTVQSAIQLPSTNCETVKQYKVR